MQVTDKHRMLQAEACGGLIAAAYSLTIIPQAKSEEDFQRRVIATLEEIGRDMRKIESAAGLQTGARDLTCAQLRAVLAATCRHALKILEAT